MEYLNVENWELIRSILGVLICLVSILYIKQNRPSFSKTLGREMSNKNYRKIKKQVDRLKAENMRAHQLLSRVNGTTSFYDDAAAETIKKKASQVRRNIGVAAPESKALASEPVRNPAPPKVNNPYEQVRIYVNAGMDREEIYEKMDLPTAEIDLMLKFNQLAKVSQLSQKTQKTLRAYG